MKRFLMLTAILAYITLMLLVFGPQAKAYDLQVLEMKRVSVEGYKYQEIHDPYIAPDDKTLTYGGQFSTDFYFLKWGKNAGFYWNNDLGFDQNGANGHIAHVGWHYEMGLTLWEKNDVSKVEIFKEHYSRHVVDEARQSHFPVMDRYGLRFNLYP